VKLDRSVRTLAITLALALLPATARTAATTVSGEVKAGDGGLVNGIVLIEEGRLYSKKFRYGGVLENGLFSIPVKGGGDYGLHIYATGYVYFPVGLAANEGEDVRGSYTLPPNPAAAHSPVLSDIRFEREEGQLTISVQVDDPDGNLSHQVLAFNHNTGQSFRMSPPSFVLPFTRVYPNGRYTLRTTVQQSSAEDWFFVAADNKCYNSPILGYPFDQTGVMESRSATIQDSPLSRPGDLSGEQVFSENCSMCHYSDSEDTRVGPGLKGLYKMDATPTLKKPVTDENIRSQIVNGGKEMPPYSHLSKEQVDAVVEYLKSL
jgi:cytochrome c5